MNIQLLIENTECVLRFLNAIFISKSQQILNNMRKKLVEPFVFQKKDILFTCNNEWKDFLLYFWNCFICLIGFFFLSCCSLPLYLFLLFSIASEFICMFNSTFCRNVIQWTYFEHSRCVLTRRNGDSYTAPRTSTIRKW